MPLRLRTNSIAPGSFRLDDHGIQSSSSPRLEMSREGDIGLIFLHFARKKN
jgi:hypothetical protein